MYQFSTTTALLLMIVCMRMDCHITGALCLSLLHSNLPCTISAKISSSEINFRVHGRHSTDTKQVPFCDSYAWRLSVCLIYIMFFTSPLLPAHCRCRGLLLRLITHNDIQVHSVGLLWTRDRPVAETCTWQHTAFTRDRYSCPRCDSKP
jgi:hypothetical protein